jgi:hypothetical protein
MNMQESPSILTLESTTRGAHQLGDVVAGDVRLEVSVAMAANDPSRTPINRRPLVAVAADGIPMVASGTSRADAPTWREGERG